MQLCLLSWAPMPLLLPPLTRRMINVPPRWVGYHLKAEAEKQFEEKGGGGTPLSLLCKHMTHHRILKSGLRAWRGKELRLVMPCSRACAYRTGGDLTSTFILKVSPRGLCNPNQVQANHENPIFFHEPFLDLAFSNSLTCIFTDSNDICGWLSYFKQLKICFSPKK